MPAEVTLQKLRLVTKNEI